MAVMILVLGGCSGGGSSSGKDSVTAKPNPGQSNSAPSISGAPSTAVMIDSDYSFIPSADDADGDPITFSIKNLPRWASFDSSTGRLTGRPKLEDVGLYERISITVSDGSATNSLPGFSIEVTDSALGAITLTWTPPTENTDGSVLTNLAGYYLYYGQSEGNYPNRIRISNPSVTTYVIENLLPRTYYVVATAFNGSGIESTYSGVAVKTVTAQ